MAGTSFVLLKATCCPNPNPRTSGPGLAGHLVLSHEPTHLLNVLDLIFFYNMTIINIIIIVNTSKVKTQWIHIVKKSTQHSITKISLKFSQSVAYNYLMSNYKPLSQFIKYFRFQNIHMDVDYMSLSKKRNW